MGTATSDYLLIFHEKPERYHALPLEERREAMDRWNAWCDELAANGRIRQGTRWARRPVGLEGGRGATHVVTVLPGQGLIGATSSSRPPPR